ncbi:hypothetical protein DFH09DRAFT_1284049 [Mycena vulgaris]|nr:hypothetical protein DFH09DRAFT_1284049 [Mycena vulgaris]
MPRGEEGGLVGGEARVHNRWGIATAGGHTTARGGDVHPLRTLPDVISRPLDLLGGGGGGLGGQHMQRSARNGSKGRAQGAQGKGGAEAEEGEHREEEEKSGLEKLAKTIDPAGIVHVNFYDELDHKKTLCQVIVDDFPVQLSTTANGGKKYSALLSQLIPAAIQNDSPIKERSGRLYRPNIRDDPQHHHLGKIDALLDGSASALKVNAMNEYTLRTSDEATFECDIFWDQLTGGAKPTAMSCASCSDSIRAQGHTENPKEHKRAEAAGLKDEKMDGPKVFTGAGSDIPLDIVNDRAAHDPMHRNVSAAQRERFAQKWYPVSPIRQQEEASRSGPEFRVELPALGDTPGEQVARTFKAKTIYCLQTVQWACRYPVGWGPPNISGATTPNPNPVSSPMTTPVACCDTSSPRSLTVRGLLPRNSSWMPGTTAVTARQISSADCGAIQRRLMVPNLISLSYRRTQIQHRIAEQLNSWLNGFESQLRQMSEVNYDCFIHAVMMIYTERVEQRVQKKDLGLTEAFWAEATGD